MMTHEEKDAESGEEGGMGREWREDAKGMAARAQAGHGYSGTGWATRRWPARPRFELEWRNLHESTARNRLTRDPC